MIIISEAWKQAYPGASIGILAMKDVTNPERHIGLDRRKEDLEVQLRSRFSDYDRAALKAHPTIQAYEGYYKRYKKTYHVRLQLESLVFKGKGIPHISALVEAMFMAELKHLLLTAGHDLDAVKLPITVDIADGNERYIGLGGKELTLKPGDMMIRDSEGILSSVLFGPDQRTRITPQTRKVLFTVYAPLGISPEDVRAHLEDIQSNVLIIAPEATVETLEVYPTA